MFAYITWACDQSLCFTDWRPLQDEAEAFISANKSQAGHFESCFQLFEATSKPEVQFWCIKSILEVRLLSICRFDFVKSDVSVTSS